MKRKINRIRFLRITKLYSQQEMADLLGISQTYYAKLEKEPRKMKIELAEQVKAILGAEHLEDLLGDVC